MLSDEPLATPTRLCNKCSLTYIILFYGLACSKYKPGRAISACVPHKILDDVTQRPTKLIRTELVKMTSEASLLPTDLMNLHQAVYRSRRKMFSKPPKSMNAFEVKHVTNNYFSWQMTL